MGGVSTTMCSVSSAAYDPRCAGNDPSVLDVVNDGLGAFFSATANLAKAAVDIDTYVPIIGAPLLLTFSDIPARYILRDAYRMFAPTDEQYAADLASVEYSYLNPAYWIDQPLHAAHSFSTSFGTALPAGAALAVGCAPEAFGIGVPVMGAVTATDLKNFYTFAQSSARASRSIDGALGHVQSGIRAIDTWIDGLNGRYIMADAALLERRGHLVDLSRRLSDLRVAAWEEPATFPMSVQRMLTPHRGPLSLLDDPLWPANAVPRAARLPLRAGEPVQTFMPTSLRTIAVPTRRSAPRPHGVAPAASVAASAP